jgi:hypothetical protein
MAQMITGYWVSQMVYVAAKLGLADLLADGPKSVEELARATSTHPRSLGRLLRALASLGVFSGDNEARYQLSPLADCLRNDVPGSRHAMALMMGEEHYRAWGNLLDSIQTGTIAFDQVYGKPVFDYLAEHPEQAAIFDAAMTSVHGRETKATLDAYDFSGIGTLVDVGGGNASNLIGILQHVPTLRGILFDLPHVIERARANIEAAGLADRCERIAGDFFNEIPVKADAYFLRHIIHDWDDERALRILRNLHRSMPVNAKLLVVEYVLPPGNAPSFGKLLDINMMVMPGGIERTEDEFRSLYEAAGFRLNQVVRTEGDLSVVEGFRA